ncbi:MAG: hypothetical protein CL935_05350 [Deltaproteobacteria bacterium]|nr:hypothetical protein [Deltaproteobacteria bacterium]
MLGFKFLKVKGISMYPLIPEHSYILVYEFCKFFIQEKKIFIFQHKNLGLLVKKLTKIDNEENLWFESLNENGLSTSQIGPINKKDLVGIVLHIIK